jgi:hypothetical protein
MCSPLTLVYPSGALLVASPSWEDPRLVFEAGPFPWRWQASKHLDAYSFLGRVKRNFLRIATLAKFAQPLVGGCETPKFARWLEDSGIGHARRIVLVGRKDQRQKWTTICVDSIGRPVAYLKYGEKEASQRQVVVESEILKRLPMGLGPELLRVDTIGTGVALLMRPVQGRPVVSNPLADATERAIRVFMRCCAVGRPVRALAHPAIKSRDWPDDLRDALTCLAEVEMPIGWQHGDLTPWNLRIAPTGTVAAIDWEDALEAGCPWFDVVYFVLQTHQFLRDACPQRAIKDSVRWLMRVGLNRSQSVALTRVAACDAWLRWREQGWLDEHALQRFRMKIWRELHADA